MGNRQLRNEWMDVVRFWAMLGVFFSHCRFPGWTGEYIRRFSTLAVPLFFASSGYFSARIEKKHCQRRFLQMCRIVFVANVFYFFYDLVELLATGQDLFEFIRDTFTIKNLIVFLLLNESPPARTFVVPRRIGILQFGAFVMADLEGISLQTVQLKSAEPVANADNVLTICGKLYRRTIS